MHDKNNDTSFLHNWGNIFYMGIFWEYYQKPYLEPNQKSMVELFSKKAPL